MGWILGCFRAREQKTAVLRHGRNKRFQRITGAYRAARRALIRRDKGSQIIPQEDKHGDKAALLRKCNGGYGTLHEDVQHLRSCGVLMQTPAELKTFMDGSAPSPSSLRDVPGEQNTSVSPPRDPVSERVVSSNTVDVAVTAKAQTPVPSSPVPFGASDYLNIEDVFSNYLFFTDLKENEDICIERGDLFSCKDTQQATAYGTVLASVENLPNKKALRLDDLSGLQTPPRGKATEDKNAQLGRMRALSLEDMFATETNEGSHILRLEDVLTTPRATTTPRAKTTASEQVSLLDDLSTSLPRAKPTADEKVSLLDDLSATLPRAKTTADEQVSLLDDLPTTLPRAGTNEDQQELRLDNTVITSQGSRNDRDEVLTPADAFTTTPARKTSENVLEDAAPSTAESSIFSGSTSSSKSFSSFNSDDRPILGIVAAHWRNSPKPWDGKGIPNSTTKYKEDQEVKWENTPFETRLERALASQMELCRSQV